MFSADSKTVSFSTRGLRIETWNLADQQRTELHDMVIPHGCVETEISPDGKFLACAEMLNSFRYNPVSLAVSGTIDLRLYDLSTGQVAFEKKDFCQPYIGILGRPLLIVESEDMRYRVTTMRFSPDGHYFLAASHNDDALALELPSLKPVPVARGIKKYLNREFMFTAPDQLVGVGAGTTNASALVRFPSGDVVEELTLGLQNIEAAAHGKFVLLRPIDKFPLGVMDLETKKIFMADPNSAFDLYDSVALVAHANGEIGLKQVTTKQDIASLLLPRGPLAPLRAEALSPDLKFLALSERSRGAVWDLTTNERPFYVRGFEGAYFTPDDTLYADFPKVEGNARMIGQLNVNSHAQSPAYKVEENHVDQFGPFLLARKPNGPDQNIQDNITLEVRDATSNSILWTRPIPNGAPYINFSSVSGSMALMWRLSTISASNEMKANPDLAKSAESVPKDDKNFLIEILDGRTGKMTGGLIVDTNKGSFVPVTVFAAGDHVFISDSANRVEVYSLASGQQTAKVFGRSALVSTTSGVVAAENEAGQLLIYDLSTMEKRDELLFNSPIAMKRFSDDGKRLFVLTTAQTAYVFDVAALSKSSAASSTGGQ